MSIQQPGKDPVILTLHQWFVISCSFSFILVSARVAATGSLAYVFLVWNLFLAFIPYAISYWLCDNIHRLRNKLKLIGLIGAWLLFVPNAFYILTDIYHLVHIDSAPKWFDLLLLLSFAWNGLFFGLLSMRKMETVLHKTSGKTFSSLIIFFVMLLNAYGIYLGRILRFNSWDIVAQPFSLFGEMFEMLLHPFDNRTEWGMIFCYAVFMTLLYITMKKLAESFNQLNK